MLSEHCLVCLEVTQALGSRRKIVTHRVYGDIQDLLGDDADWWLYVNVGEASLSSFNLLS